MTGTEDHSGNYFFFSLKLLDYLCHVNVFLENTKFDQSLLKLHGMRKGHSRICIAIAGLVRQYVPCSRQTVKGRE